MNKFFVRGVSKEPDTGFALAVHNPLIGVFNFIVLNLPTGWRVKVGDFPPEVYSSIKLDDIRWVREGTSTNYMYHDQGNALRLQVNIKEKQNNQDITKKIVAVESRSVYLNGHEARTVTGQISRGLVKKNLFEYLRMVLYCDVTRRSIDMAMEGHCSEASLRNLIDTLQLSKCH